MVRPGKLKVYGPFKPKIDIYGRSFRQTEHTFQPSAHVENRRVASSRFLP